MRTDRDVVEAFWAAMGKSRFDDLVPLIGDGFICEWPHTGERIVGRESFVEIQRIYPGSGSITVERLVDDGAGQVVTQCRVAWDGSVIFAVSFFTLVDGVITHLLEWWPEPYEPPAWRAHLVERVTTRFNLPRLPG